MPQNEKPKNLVVLPNLLKNSVYVKGLKSPLEAVAEILDEQDHPSYALALRNAATICEVFAAVCLDETAILN